MAASKVGFVGLGVMGLSMARNIIRGGHSVTGYDISDEALDKFRQSDGRIAESPAEAASGSAATVVMVPNPEHVEDVVHGRSGILEGLPENAFLKIQTFFETMPKLRENKKYKCEKCSYEEEVTLEGLQNFLG